MKPEALQTTFLTRRAEPTLPDSTTLDRASLVASLDALTRLHELPQLRASVAKLRDSVLHDRGGYASIDERPGEDTVTVRTDILLSSLDQVLAAQTLERATYYVRRLSQGFRTVRTTGINDINLNRWKEYEDVITDSLWIIPRRDNSGAHIGDYWGNFVPQIPHQLMLRYTKASEWVLDAFVGSGTTLIEGKRLGRNCIGLELNSDVAARATDIVAQEPNIHGVTAEIAVGDNRTVDIGALLSEHGVDKVQLLIMHPPYHDIIKFSDDKRDLSNAYTTEDFLEMFGESVDNATPHLQKGRYFAVVIGDKYSQGEWVPLAFRCMDVVLQRGYQLKSIIVKNFDETKGKRNQKELWRYRALAGGFYIFKHEYILLFQKR